MPKRRDIKGSMATLPSIKVKKVRISFGKSVSFKPLKAKKISVSQKPNSNSAKGVTRTVRGISGRIKSVGKISGRASSKPKKLSTSIKYGKVNPNKKWINYDLKIK